MEIAQTDFMQNLDQELTNTAVLPLPPIIMDNRLVAAVLPVQLPETQDEEIEEIEEMEEEEEEEEEEDEMEEDEEEEEPEQGEQMVALPQTEGLKPHTVVIMPSVLASAQQVKPSIKIRTTPPKSSEQFVVPPPPKITPSGIIKLTVPQQ